MHLSRIALSLALLFAVPAMAQSVSEVPYWAAIRASEVNMRVGPGEDYRIAWVYKRKQLPLKVLRVMDGWRLVEDPDGARGWMLARFLARQDSAIVRGKGLAEMREAADPAARLLWRVEPGVVGLVDECDRTWCRFITGPHRGFVRRERLWGATDPE